MRKVHKFWWVLTPALKFDDVAVMKRSLTPCFLVGDCGGTNLRFSLVPVESPPATAKLPPVLWSARYPTADFDGMPAALAKLHDDIEAWNKFEIVRCSLAVCGPVDPNGRTLCLAPCMGKDGWSFDEAEVAAALALPADGRVRLLNDFVAVGLALPLAKGHAHVIHPGDGGATNDGPLACLGPGTGLGMCFCVPTTDGTSGLTTWEVHPSEGGMAPFSPATYDEWKLREHIESEYEISHVETERVVSGNGIHNIYKYLYSIGKAAAQGNGDPMAFAPVEEAHKRVVASAEPAAVIASTASTDPSGGGKICKAAIDMFLDCLGAEAGNVACRFLPRGGVILAGGGIVPKLLSEISDGRVAASYLNKGSTSDIYRSIPLLALDVDGDVLGLLGSWQHAWQLHRISSSDASSSQPPPPAQQPRVTPPQPINNPEGSSTVCFVSATMTRSYAPYFVPPEFTIPLTYTSGRLSLRKLSSELLDSDYIAVMGSCNKLTSVFAKHDNWPTPTLSRQDDLEDLSRHESEFNKRLAFAYTVTPSSEAHMRLPTTLGCVYLNPATRKGYDAECILWVISHGLTKTEEKELDDELEYLVRKWLLDVWPFKSVAFPGRPSTGGMQTKEGWEVFEALPFRDENVPRIARDAQTVVMYNARACGLALGV